VISLCLDRVVIRLFGLVGEVQTGAWLPTVTPPRSCEGRYPPFGVAGVSCVITSRGAQVR